MRRSRFHLLVVLHVAFLAGSCVVSETPTGVGGDVRVGIAIQPALIPSPADGGAGPINRIRARVSRVSDQALLGETVVDVSPTDPSWEVVLDATLSGESVDVMLYVLLINVTAGVESVEFSGLAGPLTLVANQTTEATDIPIVRGPIGNFFVTGISITSAPATLVEGGTGTLQAVATSSDSVDVTVYWTALDSAVLSTVDSTVTAVAPGTGRVVASAGTFTDTASIVVTPAADLGVAKAVAPATAQEADTVDYEIVVTNASTYDLVGVAVRDSVPTGVSVVSVVPAGTFDPPSSTYTWTVDLGPGAADTIRLRGTVDSGLGNTTLVNVASADPPAGFTDPSPGDNRSTASLIVSTPVTGPDLQLSVAANASTPLEGDTVQVTVSVENLIGSGIDVTNIAVQNVADAGLTLLTSAPSQGAFDAQTGVWSVGDVLEDDAAVLSIDFEIASGTAGQTLTDSAWVTATDQAQIDLGNDTSFVQLTVAQQALDVEISKTVDEPQPLEDSTVVFTVRAVNRGPGSATNLAVFDTLDSSAFLNPIHAVSVGSLVDDSLWTIPVLAEGDTAVWTTTTTVATGVAGGSASNTAILRGLSEVDATPANDTAVVAMNFPVSGVPVVQIIAPADSSVFDPGVSVTFTGVATDPEDGDLSPVIEWESSVDGALATGRSFSTSQLSAGVHTITATATDLDAGTGADTIRVTIALITTPTTLNVPFGGTASLPITLSEAAQAGGLTLDVTAADPAVTTPTASTVFIAGGTLAGNATLQGLTPGTTDVTVSNPQFGASVTSVSVTAELDILQGSLVVPETFPQPITVQLESQGVAISAPTGGLGVTLTSLDPTCVTGPGTITIPDGLVQQTATLSYGGSAQLPCSAYVRLSAPSVATDSVNVTVNAQPSFSVPVLTVGAGLQYGNFWATLGTTAHGGVTVRLESEDPGIMLVAPDATTPGEAFIDVAVPNGQNRAFYYVQGVEGTTGTASFVASAPGFSTDSALVTVAQPGFDVVALNTNGLTTFSPDDDFWVRVGVPNGQLTGLSINQAIRAGGQVLTATVTSSDPAVGDLVTLPDSASPVTVTLGPGDFNSATSVAIGGVAFEPIAGGTTTVSATIPGLLQTNNAVLDVTVSTPNISLSSLTVGAGLQYGLFSATLGATDHGGVTVRLESADPSVMLVSPDANTPGTAFIDVVVAAGQNRANYYVQGVEGQTGVVPLNVSAPGFNSNSADVTVVQPAIDIVSLTANTTSFSPDDPFWVRTGVPNGPQTGLQISQAVRAGGQTLTATLSSSAPAVGDLITLPDSASPVTVTLAPGDFNSATTVANGGVAFEPIDAGSTDVVATVPGYITTNNASRRVNVTAPTINIGPTTVGAGLQYGTFFATLGASDHPGVTLRIESTDPAVMLVSPNNTTVGTAFFDTVLPTGQTSVQYWVHGVEGTTGVVPLQVSAAGFTTNTADITVVQPAYDVSGLSLNQTPFNPNDFFQVRVGIPNGQVTALSVLQSVRVGGTTLTPTITSSNLGVGQLVTTSTTGGTVTADVVPGSFATPSSLALGGVEFEPLGNGVTTVSASIADAGWLATDDATRDVTVTAPAITMPATTVGGGLMYGTFFASLGATQHGGVTVTLTSSNPSVLLLSPDNQTAGTASIQVAVQNGLTQAGYWVHGVEGATGTVTITATANGFTDGTASTTVVQPGLDFVSLGSSYSAGAADDPFYARLGVPNANDTDISIQQAIRIGGDALTVTLTSDNTAAAQLVTQSNPGTGSLQLQILPGQATTPTSVAAGGVALDPLAVGTTFIEATVPGVITTTDGTRTVTITP